MHRTLAFMFAVGLAACAPASSGDSDDAQGALAESRAPAKVRYGSYEYRYPGREGLVKRLVLRAGTTEGAAGTFERTEWRRENGRLQTSKVTGTFTTSTKAMPEFTRQLIHFKLQGGPVETYRYRNDDNGDLQLQPDVDNAPRSPLRLFEAADGTKAVFADCRATRVHDMTIFEESFSVDEYPDVEIYKAPDNGYIDVSIGSSGFSSGDGDQLSVSATADGVEARIARAGDLTHVVRVRGTSGEVISTENGHETQVATLRCKAR